MAKSGTIAALDIGSSKIICFIAHISSSGKINITGIGHQISQGIKAGIVIDIKQAENSILAAVNSAEKMAGETIDRVIINVSGSSIGSHIINVEVSISGHAVTDLDVSHIIQRGCEKFRNSEMKIIHCNAINYAIDDSNDIKDPRQMYGNVLNADIHVITASQTTVKNLTNCLAHCHINVDDYVTSPNMSALSCLSDDEKNLGAILLDIGAGSTSIALYAQGHCIYVDSIAIGGMHITRDIARGFSISLEYAERIKNIYGTVMTCPTNEREIIDIPLSELQSDINDTQAVGLEDKYISKAYLTAIIKPRVEEILELALKNIEQSGFFQVSGPRIILTGGTSQLLGIKELAGYIFKKHARIGKPIDIEGLADSIKGPPFSTAVGMLMHMASKQTVEAGSLGDAENLKQTGGFRNIVKWFTSNF